MANIVKIKRGTGAPQSLEIGEPAVDITTGNVYVGTTSGVHHVNANVNPTDAEIVSSINNELGSTDWQSGGGSSKEYASFYLNGAGATALKNTEVTLTLNGTSVNSNSSIFNLAANTVTVNKTGNFEINVNVYLNNSSTSRSEFSMWIEKNGTEIAGTRFASYQRGYDSGMSSGVNFMVAVTSGDTFTIQCQRTDGATTAGYQDANGTRFNIKEM
jgi:archaellum component FlaF (FlaF/FlaG flagellin family)